MKLREQLIQSYIEAYNNLDIEGMLKNLAPDIKFENISGGEINMTLNGLPEFKTQAEQSKKLFTSRKQTVTDFRHHAGHTNVSISYHAVLAIDLPNGMKKGHTLNLTGKSIFKFSEDKIVGIIDIS